MKTTHTYRIGFFLIPDFSMLSFSAVIEPLRMANRLAGYDLYQWDIYGFEDKEVSASNGVSFSPTQSVNNIAHLDLLLVVAGIGAHVAAASGSVNQWLKQALRQGIAVGSTSTGSVLLAKAGLLKNKTCTVHWESANSLAEEFPNINVTSELYEFDPRTPTCSGGLAGLDMMLHLITNQHGSDLANQVAEQCIHPAIRPAHDKQRMSLIRKHNIRHPRLLDAVEIMEANMEEPLKCYEIGEQVGLSVRQMERLFLQYLQDKPGNYYLQLRLERAQHLLLQTMLSITQISTACGFSSTSYFARCYKKRYEKTPREERRLA
ncbi:TPA: GlxA family transcriptional regulator [Vibrio diabolicus]